MGKIVYIVMTRTVVNQKKQKFRESGPLSRHSGPGATREAALQWGKLALGRER